MHTLLKNAPKVLKNLYHLFKEKSLEIPICYYKLLLVNLYGQKSRYTWNIAANDLQMTFKWPLRLKFTFFQTN